MSLYKYYFEVSPSLFKMSDKALKSPEKAKDIYRRIISVAINKLHHISQKKSIGGYALAILESNLEFQSLPSVRVQSKIRVYTKKKSSLDHLLSVLKSDNLFHNIYNISEVQSVPEPSQGYFAFIRVRIPTKRKHEKSYDIKQRMISLDPDCNFIYLMPSSSIKGNKRLIRYYYKCVEMELLKTAKFSKPDGYGFSRTNRLCVVDIIN